MTNLLTRILGRERHDTGIAPNVGTLGQLASQYAGSTWPVHMEPGTERVATTDAIRHWAHTYGPLPAALFARQLIIGQYRPKWRSEIDGSIRGSAALAPLERPLFYRRTELYRRIEADASIHGTAFVLKTRHTPTGLTGLTLLPPTRVKLLLESPMLALDLLEAAATGQRTLAPEDMPDSYISQVLYSPGGWDSPSAMDKAVSYSPDDVAIYAPEPDDRTKYTGKSWVQSILHDIMADHHVAEHVDSFLSGGAVPGFAVVFPREKDGERPLTNDELAGHQNALDRYYSGSANRGRALILAGGAQVTPIGSTLDQMQLRDLTSGYEARIAMRARIPASILGLKEALQGSSLAQGNFASARGQWGDSWGTPALEDLALALEPLATPRLANHELSYQPDTVGFFQEDAADAAQIAQTNANAVRTLIDGGFAPDAAVEMVSTGNVTALDGEHTGLPSVQLQQTEAADQPTETNDEEGDDD